MNIKVFAIIDKNNTILDEITPAAILYFIEENLKNKTRFVFEVQNNLSICRAQSGKDKPRPYGLWLNITFILRIEYRVYRLACASSSLTSSWSSSFILKMSISSKLARARHLPI